MDLNVGIRAFTCYLVLQHNQQSQEMITHFISIPQYHLNPLKTTLMELLSHVRLEISYEVVRNSLLAKLHTILRYYCSIDVFSRCNLRFFTFLPLRNEMTIIHQIHLIFVRNTQEENSKVIG